MTTEADNTIAALGLPSVESILERIDAVLGQVDFVDCDSVPEEVHHERPIDAIDDRYAARCPGPEDGPLSVSVYGYRRAAVDERDYVAAGLAAAMAAIEHMDEEYGAGLCERPEVAKAQANLAEAVVALVREHYPPSLVWRVDRVSGVDLTEEERWAMAIEMAPLDERAEWVEAANAWLAEPKDGAA